MWSAQLSGRKRWWLAPPDSVYGTLLADLELADERELTSGCLATARYSAAATVRPVCMVSPGARLRSRVPELPRSRETFQADLEPGDVIVWYAGWTHATAALDFDGGVAVSVEFARPPPLTYAQRFAPWLHAHARHFGSYTHCLANWGIEDS